MRRLTVNATVKTTVKTTVNVTVIERKFLFFSVIFFISVKNTKNPESLAPQDFRDFSLVEISGIEPLTS